ncbi:hypothetical protein N665_0427s0004 [Sinapis alba]|nr:hypothetical protein N665_0427s0004 [Sinapis alba]
MFATDRFPSGRLNIYSKPDILAFVREVLRDTPEFQTIRESSFGKLFDLPARQCHVSCKLIYSILSRQLIVGDPHTLWTEFGGQPLRSGLQEFGTITALPCGAYPREKDMPGWKKIRLDLILIVDGVLIAHKQTPRPTLNYVQMVEDLDSFFQFPWGRESFSKTVACMKPIGGTILSKKTTCLINLNDLLLIEVEKYLSVSPIIPIESQPQPGWGVWSDVVNDESLFHMEQLIADKRPLKKHMWLGGDNSLPIITRPTVHEKPVHKKSLKPKHPTKKKPLPTRRTTQKPSTARKQRRISNYFLRTGSTSNNSNQHLADTVSELVTKMLKRIKQRYHTKHPSLNSLPSSMIFFRKRRQKGQPQSAHPHGFSTREHGTTSTNPPDHASPIITSPSPDQKYPIHVSPIHHSPTPVVGIILTSSVHVTPEVKQAPSTTSQPRHSEIYDASAHLNSPDIHHFLFHGVEIFDLVSPITRTQATHNPSPTKSTETGSGFAPHATSVNAFSATATSSRMPSLNSLIENRQVMELSDSSPARETLTHTPSEAETHLASALMSCSSLQTMSERHNQLLARERLLFCTPYLTSIIQHKWRKFKAARRKDLFHWDKRLRDLVTTPGKCWMEDFSPYTHQ